MSGLANRYANLVGSNKIKDEWQKINTGFDLVQQDVDAEVAAREELEERVDNIIAGGSEDKDPELVDIRTPDPSYTPQREINVAGDVTRDMQAQFAAHLADDVSDGVHGMGSAAAQDYEEGNWTPTIQGSSTPGTNTYDTQTGRYIRIGNQVTCWFSISLSAKDPAMGGITYIAGLPFLADPNARAGVSFGRVSNIDLATGYTAVTGYASGRVIILQEYGDNMPDDPITVGQLKDNTMLWGSITYKI